MQAFFNTLSRSYIARFAVATVLYGVMLWGSLLLIPAGGPGATLVWPPSALGLAMLLLWGLDLWPAIAVACCVVLLVHGVSPPLVVTAAVANSLEALIAAYLLLYHTGFSPLLGRLRDTLGLIVAAFIASFCAVSITTLGMYFFNQQAAPDIALWLALWSGHNISLLSFGPFFIRWLYRPVFKRTALQLLEWAAVFGAITILLVLLFWTPYSNLYGISLEYVLIVPMLWVAWRTGPRGIVLALFLLALIGSTGVLYGYGELARSANPAEAVFGVQLAIGALSFMSLLFTSIVEERKEAVNDLQHHVDQLEQALEKLGSQDQAKTDFIAVLAHELRNPLSPLLSGLELLKMRGESPDDVLRMMGGHLNTAVRLLDDLLDISRITQKRFKLQKEPVAIHTVVESALEMVEPVYKRRGHTLTTTLPQEEVWLSADPVRLAQVLVNLLNNSAKYTDPGGTIGLAVTRSGDELCLTVTDNGIGIDPARLAYIFESFGGPEGNERRPGGLRIGLALAKRMTEMHHGTIAAHSGGVGKGTRFTVRLPVLLEVPLPMEQRAPVRGRYSKQALADSHGSSRRVMVVDDNVAAADGLSTLLRINGHEVLVAYDGASALRLTDKKPDVALLDIDLPDMDGYELGRRLRAQCGAGLRLIALSGYGQSEDKQKAKDAGFEDYLVKPVSIVDLERSLSGSAPR